MSTTSYLSDFLEPVAESFTPEVARRIADLRAKPELQARISELADKANEGTLTSAEEDEYKQFVHALDVFCIIQLKARRFLATHPE